jgi:hypothetical protein
MSTYEPSDLRSRTPERLAAAAEQVAGTVESVDRALRDMSDREIASLAEDAPAPKAWAAMTMDERRSWRALNEQARRARVGAQEAAKAAEDEARQRQAVEAAQAEARAVLRAAFVGTDAEFAEAWPRLWARHRDRLALDAAAAGYDATVEAKRRQIGGL